VPENIINVLHRVRGPFNVSTPAIAAATSAMRDVEWTAKAKQHNTRELKRMAAFYQSIGLIVHPSVGNFILVESKEGAEGIAKIYEHLKSHAILTRKVENYGLPSCLRITIGTEDENNALISALEQFSA
jgi:histidinol-phosphate aminotransferase